MTKHALTDLTGKIAYSHVKVNGAEVLMVYTCKISFSSNSLFNGEGCGVTTTIFCNDTTEGVITDNSGATNP